MLLAAVTVIGDSCLVCGACVTDVMLIGWCVTIVVVFIGVPPSLDEATTTVGVVLGAVSNNLPAVCAVASEIVELMLVAFTTMLDLVGVDSNPTVDIADGDPGAALAVMILCIVPGLPPLLNCALIGCCSHDFVDPPVIDTVFIWPPGNGIRDPGDE